MKCNEFCRGDCNCGVDVEHATSDVPDEWQGLPDYMLDDLEVGTSGSDQ